MSPTGGISPRSNTELAPDEIRCRTEDLPVGDKSHPFVEIITSRGMPLGGEPFGEIVMWGNFVGRSHDEIIEYRDA
ncbi:hypothetical protein GQ85_02270 [Rhodococcus rhodochrous]|nr:hypothetical protein GQ85_02270 [Rhodococcus rhodochrous]